MLRKSDGEKDVLTQTLRIKEHPSHTRGVRDIPWNIASRPNLLLIRAARGVDKKQKKCS